MLKVKKLIQQIARGLDEGADAIAMRKDAADFAELCQVANGRLEQCEVLIEGGQEHNAIALAEVHPPVLDLVAQLGFLRADDWRTYCKENGLPVPWRINADAVRKLNALYGRISGSDHKIKDALFKEYRAAIMERNDEAALVALRTIAKLFPGDPAATTDFPRMEAKVFQSKVDALGALVVEGDNAGASALLSEIEQTFPHLQSEAPQWAEANAIRRRLEQDRAVEDCRHFIREAVRRMDGADWEGAFENLGAVATLRRDFEIDLNQGDLAAYQGVQHWAKGKLEAAKEAGQFRDSVDALLGHVEVVNGKEHRSQAAKLPELLDDQNRLERLWAEVARFDREVPKELEQKVGRCAKVLKADIGRRQGLRRKALVGVGILVLVIGGAVATFTVLLFQSRSMASELARLREAGEYRASVKFLDEIRAGNGLVRRFSGLKSAVGETEAWQDLQRVNGETFVTKVAALKAEAEGGFLEVDGSGVANTEAKFAAVEVLQSGLAQDLRIGADSDFTDAKSAWGRRLGALRQTNIDRFKELRTELESELKALGALDPGIPDSAERVKALAAKVAEFEMLANPGVEALKLPEAFDGMVTETLAGHGQLREQSDRWSEVEEKLRASRHLDEYAGVLAAVADEFGLASAVAARDTIGTESDFIQELLMPGNAAGWERFKSNAYAPILHPDPAEQIPPGDLSILRSLRDSESLGNIYLYTVVDSTPHGNSPAYAKGELAEAEAKTEAGVTQMVQEGALYLPWNSPDTAYFGDLEWVFNHVGTGIIGNVPPKPRGLSPESAAFAALDLGSYHDRSITHYEPKSLTAALDQIIALKGVNPLFKAYLHREIGSLMEFSAKKWGLEWTGVESHLKTLKAIVEGSGLDDSSWMVPAQNDRLGKRLSDFYDGIQGTNYGAQLRTLPGLIGRAALAGFTFVGFVSGDGSAVVRNGVTGSRELWGFASDRKPALLFKADGQAAAEALLYSPLFEFGGDRAEILGRVTKMFGEDIREDSILDKLPPFFKVEP